MILGRIVEMFVWKINPGQDYSEIFYTSVYIQSQNGSQRLVELGPAAAGPNVNRAKGTLRSLQAASRNIT